MTEQEKKKVLFVIPNMIGGGAERDSRIVIGELPIAKGVGEDILK